MNKLLNEMETLLSSFKLPDRHSFFQLQHFVIGKEYSDQGRMWQCLREIKSRLASLRAISREISDLKDRKELIAIQEIREEMALAAILERPEIADNEKSLFSRERNLKQKQLDRQKDSIEESSRELEEKEKYISQEAMWFISEFKRLNANCPAKSMDDPAAQMEYWESKLANEVNLRMLLKSPLDVDLVKSVLALPDNSILKKRVCSALAPPEQKNQIEQ